MSDQVTAEVLALLHDNAAALQRKSTLLSELIERVENFLNELPSKIEVLYKVADKKYLRFTRDKERWRLSYDDGGTGRLWLTEATVEIKAHAARFLPNLYSQLVTDQSKRLNEVEAALNALKNIPILREQIEEGSK